MLKEAQVTSAFIIAALKCGDKNCQHSEGKWNYPLGQYVSLRFEEVVI